jgi:hypothetical protein
VANHVSKLSPWLFIAYPEDILDSAFQECIAEPARGAYNSMITLLGMMVMGKEQVQKKETKKKATKTKAEKKAAKADKKSKTK